MPAVGQILTGEHDLQIFVRGPNQVGVKQTVGIQRYGSAQEIRTVSAGDVVNITQPEV